MNAPRDPMTIRIRKGRDGPNALVCTRADGTSTMQQSGTQFFPLHDLTHYAVESVLMYRKGFYGLVADGWDLKDFGSPWPRGPLPPDMDPAELIVGSLDLERGTGIPLSADDVNATITAWYAQNAPELPVPDGITDEELARIRDVMMELHREWQALEPGASLELPFPPPEPPGSDESKGDEGPFKNPPPS